MYFFKFKEKMQILETSPQNAESVILEWGPGMRTCDVLV